jgi:hypothetical protein
MRWFQIPEFRFGARLRTRRNSLRIAVGVLLLSSLPLAAEPGGNAALGVVVKPQCAVAMVRSSIGSTGETLVFRYWLRTSAGGSASLAIRNTRAGFSYDMTVPAGVSRSGRIPEATSVRMTTFPAGSHTGRDGDLGMLRWASADGDVGTEMPDLGIECR